MFSCRISRNVLWNICDVGTCFSSNIDGSSCSNGYVFTGLKKVTDDMKTKNRVDRSGAVPAGSAPSEKAPTASTAASTKKGTPKCELDGRKYVSSLLVAVLRNSI